jgi:hypothetical protein
MTLQASGLKRAYNGGIFKALENLSERFQDFEVLEDKEEGQKQWM